MERTISRALCIASIAVAAALSQGCGPDYHYRGINIFCHDGLCYEPEEMALIIDAVLSGHHNDEITGAIHFQGDVPVLDGKKVWGYARSTRVKDRVHFRTWVWWRPCLNLGALAHELMHPLLYLEQQDPDGDHSHTRAWNEVARVNENYNDQNECEWNALQPIVVGPEPGTL